jgi:hypothetical protein
MTGASHYYTGYFLLYPPGCFFCYALLGCLHAWMQASKHASIQACNPAIKSKKTNRLPCMLAYIGQRPLLFFATLLRKPKAKLLLAFGVLLRSPSFCFIAGGDKTKQGVFATLAYLGVYLGVA